MKTAELTLLLGPPTRLSRALNDIVREERGGLDEAGLSTFPSRVGDRVLRDVMGGGAAGDLRATLDAEAGRPVFLGAIKGLAAPSGAFRSRELLPDAEAFLAHWARVADGLETNVVLTIDPLPDFVFALDHAAANSAVAAMPWDALYELSWAEVVQAVARAMPGAAITVLTTRGAFVSAETVLPLIFGGGAAAVPPDRLRRALLGDVSDDSPARGVARLGALYDAHVPQPPAGWASTALGLDRVTVRLLEDRFAEDLEALRALPGVSLV